MQYDSIKTIFKDDNIMIKYCKSYGTFFYCKNPKGSNIRVDITHKRLRKDTCEKMAPILTQIFNRVYHIGHIDGYHDGFKSGQNNIRTQLSDILKKE